MTAGRLSLTDEQGQEGIFLYGRPAHYKREGAYVEEH